MNPCGRWRRGCAMWCLAITVAVAAEPTWDWLPRAADDDRPCELHLAAPDGWSVRPTAGVASHRQPGQLVVSFTPNHVGQVTVLGPHDRQLSVQVIAPGHGAACEADADGELRSAGAAVVLAVPRREAAADRRWSVLRAFEHAHIEPCRHRLAEPALAPSGVPALTRQIANAQRLDPRSGGVLIALSGEDRFAAWKHREYRQALAWLVADVAARGATHVVLVEPLCPRVEEPLLAALRLQVRDVARAYRCTAIDTTALGDHACWEVSPGVLGQTLNATGLARRDQLLAAWLVDRGR